MSRESKDPTNDQTDDFQFRPLSKGLGFHRKNQNLKAEAEVEDPFQFTSKHLKNRGLDLIDQEESVEFKSPLPRTQSKEEVLTPTSSAVDEILKNLGPKKKFAADQARQEFKAAQAQVTSQSQVLKKRTSLGLQKSGVSLSAGFLDAMLITAGTLLGFIVLLTVTKIDLLANLTHPQDSGLYLATFSVFYGVTVIYYLVTRMFMGCSAGEWAYDQKLGNDQDRADFSYGPLIVVRTTINLMTGIILFPILSAIFNKDLVGQFIGLELFRNH